MNAYARVVTLTLVSHVSRAHCGLLLPACHQGVYARLRRAMEKVGMRGRSRESELVETPPHRGRILVVGSSRCPLPASGAREATLLGIRSKCQKRRHTSGRDNEPSNSVRCRPP